MDNPPNLMPRSLLQPGETSAATQYSNYYHWLNFVNEVAVFFNAFCASPETSARIPDFIELLEPA
jgi:hypothetical protein